MTFLELQNELISVAAARFKEAQRASAKFWINNRYAAVWGLEDWTFRKATGSLAVTGGSATTAAPTDFAKPIGIWDDSGVRLTYVPPRDYYDIHLSSASVPSTPTQFTIVNRVVLLDPTPSASATYTTHYEKKLTLLVADADVPALPAEHHYMLVHGATFVGAVQTNDFTYQFAQQQWQNNIDEMKQNYLDDQKDQPVQWGNYMETWRQ